MDVLFKNAEVFNQCSSALFLRSVKHTRTEIVRAFLNSSTSECGNCVDALSLQRTVGTFRMDLIAFDIERPSWSCIRLSDWLDAIEIANSCNWQGVLNLLFRYEKFVNWVNKDGWTALHIAIFQYQCQPTALQTVIILLKSGSFDVHALTNESETVLHFVCRFLIPSEDNCHELHEALQIPLRQKINVNRKNLNGQTALMMACKNENAAAVRALLNWKCNTGEFIDITARDNCGETVLTIARQLNNAKVIAMIVELSFLIAINNGNIDVAKFYLNHYSTADERREAIENYRKDNRETAAKSTAQCKTMAKLKLHSNIPSLEVIYLRQNFISSNCHHSIRSNLEVLYRRLSFSTVDNLSMTHKSDNEPLSHSSISYSAWLESLWIADRNSDYKILKFLLNNYRFIRGLDKDGQTVLHLAVKECFAKGLKSKELRKIEILLISGKCNINDVDSLEETILHLFCRLASFADGDLKTDNLLEILLKHGIDVNCRNKYGKTSLMILCEYQCDSIVFSLLNLVMNNNVNIDIDASDNSGHTALMIAKRNRDLRIFALLQRASLLSAVRFGNKSSVAFYLYRAGNKGEATRKWVEAFSYRSNINRKITFCPRYTIDHVTWRRAAMLAIEHADYDILQLLLNYDDLLQSQKGSNGEPFLHRLLSDASDFDSSHVPLIRILLESGKINVNAINFEAQTALFSIFNGCGRSPESPLCSGNHSDGVHEIISSILHHGVNVNDKDKYGQTVLSLASDNGCTITIQTILNWAKDTNTWLDLDAQDRGGRTALMKAAMRKHCEAVEMLLNSGASVNMSDIRGFTALHHALYEAMSVELWINFGDFPKNFEELKRRKEIAVTLFPTDEPHLCYNRNRKKLNDDKFKIVEMLLERADVDANICDFEGYSPMDIAEASVPEIPSCIRDALKRKGAYSNAFLRENQQSTVIANPFAGFENVLHRLAIRTKFYKSYRESDSEFSDDEERSSSIQRSDNFNAKLAKERFLKLDKVTRRKLTAAKDHKGRNPLHQAIISRQDTTDYSEAFNIVEMLISFGCDVNEADIYGRTPYHYAGVRQLELLLLSYGADPIVEDKYGMYAINMAEMLQDTEDASSSGQAKDSILQAIRRIDHKDNRRKNRKQAQLFYDESKLNSKELVKRLWEDGEYAFRHPSWNLITSEVTLFVERLASEVKRRDPRFAMKGQCVGSSYEETKIGLPDEFDFDLVLTKISQRCEVLSSPELPIGFVKLQRKQAKAYGTTGNDYDDFFDDRGILKTDQLNAQFRILVKNILTDVEFIQNDQHFEWDPDFRTDGLAVFKDKTKAKLGLAITMTLKKTWLNLEGKTILKCISIDLVPCFHIDDWWPDEAICNVGTDIRTFGCNLVFDWPQRLYPWVPYSESCVRVSFALAESETIKQSSDIAKQAYMLGKQLITAMGTNTSYILKTSLLHCIEALSPTPVLATEHGLTSDNLKSNIDRMDSHHWLDRLMKCHLNFVWQDICPCYFMPKFYLPIGEYLRAVQIECLTDDKDEAGTMNLHKHDYMIYKCIALDASEPCLEIPLLNPLSEHFDRKQFLNEITTTALKLLNNSGL